MSLDQQMETILINCLFPFQHLLRFHLKYFVYCSISRNEAQLWNFYPSMSFAGNAQMPLFPPPFSNQWSPSYPSPFFAYPTFNEQNLSPIFERMARERFLNLMETQRRL